MTFFDRYFFWIWMGLIALFSVVLGPTWWFLIVALFVSGLAVLLGRAIHMMGGDHLVTPAETPDPDSWVLPDETDAWLVTEAEVRGWLDDSIVASLDAAARAAKARAQGEANAAELRARIESYRWDVLDPTDPLTTPSGAPVMPGHHSRCACHECFSYRFELEVSHREAWIEHERYQRRLERDLASRSKMPPVEIMTFGQAKPTRVYGPVDWKLQLEASRSVVDAAVRSSYATGGITLNETLRLLNR